MKKASIDPVRFPHTAEVERYLAAERACGLVDIKFVVFPTSNTTLETFSRDFLHLVSAEKVPDPNLF